MEEETVQNIWHHLRCKDMLRGRHIIEIDSEASIAEGCDVSPALAQLNYTL